MFEELVLSAPSNFDELMSTCETLADVRPEKACIGLGSKEKWGDAFVFDSILLEEGGAESYVQFHKGEIDVANEPVYRAALEKFVQLAPYFNADHSALSTAPSVSLPIHRPPPTG